NGKACFKFGDLKKVVITRVSTVRATGNALENKAVSPNRNSSDRLKVQRNNLSKNELDAEEADQLFGYLNRSRVVIRF
ncbi:hypothetical protein PoB_002301400, partial [Plakobranchus ocellatus]